MLYTCFPNEMCCSDTTDDFRHKNVDLYFVWSGHVRYGLLGGFYLLARATHARSSKASKACWCRPSVHMYKLAR